MIVRILASLVLLFSVLFMPYWVSIILGIIGIMYFPLYFEAVIIFLISDLLFGTKEVKLYNITFVATFVSAIFLFISFFIKKRLKFYPESK